MLKTEILEGVFVCRIRMPSGPYQGIRCVYDLNAIAAPVAIMRLPAERFILCMEV